MKPIPNTENPLVLRTDFSNQSAWEEICKTILEPVGLFRFRANVQFVDDVEYSGLMQDQLMGLISKNYNHSFIIVADSIAISSPEHPLLIIDLFDNSDRVFRALPSLVQSIENNLSIANMDFEEFADAVDEDGIFRGFPEG